MDWHRPRNNSDNSNNSGGMKQVLEALVAPCLNFIAGKDVKKVVRINGKLTCQVCLPISNYAIANAIGNYAVANAISNYANLLISIIALKQKHLV